MSMPHRLRHIRGPAEMPPTNGYSHAVIGRGQTVAVSGQLPLDADGALVGGDDALLQARQVFRNVGLALHAAGAGVEDLLRLAFYLTDLANLPFVRTARDEFLDGHCEPASSLIQVAGLVLPGARLEVDALAVVASEEPA